MAREIIPDDISKKTAGKAGGKNASTAGEATHKKPAFAEKPYAERAREAYQTVLDRQKPTK